MARRVLAASVMKLTFVAVVLAAACSGGTNPSHPDGRPAPDVYGYTSPGRLTAFSLAAGGTPPWGSYTATVSADGVVAMTSNQDASASGTLTTAGEYQLGMAIDALPVEPSGTAPDPCGDGQAMTVAIDFQRGGAFSYTFPYEPACDEPGDYVTLVNVLAEIAGTLEGGSASGLVTVN